MHHHLLDFARARCVTDPYLLIAIVATNGWIAWSYLRIPVQLRAILRRVGAAAPGRSETAGFALFIGSCGLTHLFSIAVLFAPSLDWIAVTWAGWTGLISALVARRLRHGTEDIVRAVRAARELEKRLGG